MFAANDESKKFYTDAPTANIFDGSASGRALSVRYSCNYPGSIIDQLRSSQSPKQCGTPKTKASTGQNAVGTSSDMVVPPGDLSDSSSSSAGDDICRLPDVSLVPDAQNSARCGNAAGENLNREVLDPRAGCSLASQVEETIVRRQKKTESPSCTDSESDAEMSPCGSVSKNKMSQSKLQKRRKKVTANLAGTRYDVGKGWLLCNK